MVIVMDVTANYITIFFNTILVVSRKGKKKWVAAYAVTHCNANLTC
jgi:hypothetical protein